MKRQRIRKLFLIISLLLFPITLYYFSPALIFDAGMKGIINGSCIVFAVLFILSIPFGRLFCAYLCPAGGLQECIFAVNDRLPKQGWRNKIKYAIWTVWVLAVAVCYVNAVTASYDVLQEAGQMGVPAMKVDFFFETVNGISVSGIQSYVIYYGILCLILIPAVWGGKRTFCHYFCWMAPFMVLGTKLRRSLHLPGVHIKAKAKEDCISCGKCNKVCPMGIDVARQIEKGQIKDQECIQCGACVDHCPRRVLSLRFRSGKGRKVE